MPAPRHVIVCGAGVVGASVAYFLTRRGVAVTVVERTAVACAASGKSGGFLALDWCDGTPVEPLARASFALHATMAKEIARDWGYRRMDTFMLAAREKGAPAGGHRVPAPGWIDGPAVVAGTLGSSETTAQVHPAQFTAALMDEAQAGGAMLRIGAVERVIARDGAASGVVIDGRALEADAVVLAAGPWTGRIEGLRLPRVSGLKGYSVTLDVAGVPAHALFMDYRLADGRALEPEIIPRPDGTVYVCGMADRQPLPESAEGVEVSAAGCAILAGAAGRVAASLAAAPISRRQACYRPVVDDGLPMIGPVPGVRGAYVATGHGPWGMLNAPATGLALTELIVDGAARSVDLRPFYPDRLPAARP
ncbi:MAG TPA: FAD-dependent oxidoreductase [Methylomirabilota bacterium]|jgi:glycine/D-amino acid oxidase-like deaminating enzyme|nr:FAD-dependent oxidoreductase [Methylomirabilota bacterium]